MRLFLLTHEMVLDPWVFKTDRDARRFARARWGPEWEEDQEIGLRSQELIGPRLANRMILEEVSDV